MAVVVKRETTIKEQRERLKVITAKLKKEIETIKQENKQEIFKRSFIWMSILGIGLFFIFPFGFLIGWYIGRELALQRLCKNQREQLKELNHKIKMMQQGETGESKVSESIEAKLSNDYLLLNDLVIPNGRNGTQLDHVLIGNDRIYCIETKNITGKFYPHKNGWLWYPSKSQGNVRKKTIIKNPQNQSTYHAKHLTNFLKSQGFTVPIKPIVILTNRYGEWKGGQDERCPIFQVSQFIHYLKKKRETKITSVTKEELVKVLLDVNQQHSGHFYNQFE